ncbi:MAG: zeta toxin family protein [Patescibacteria group bacterium]
MLIVISGSINSGKSTIAEILAKELPNTASIEIDKLRSFVPFIPLSDELIKLNLKNAADVANNFLKTGLNTIINYPLSKENYDFLVSNIDIDKKDIHAFTLNPKLDIAANNRGARELDEWEAKRVKHHYDIGINNPGFKTTIIDNSSQAPEETAKIILKVLKK